MVFFIYNPFIRCLHDYVHDEKTSNSNQFYNYYILFDVTGPYTSRTSMFSDFISSDDVQAADFAADIDLADFTA